MKVTYKDGSSEDISKAENVEFGDEFVTFSDEDDENICEIAISEIKRLDY